MQYTILVDFGSTYTKLCVFDLENGELVLTTRHASTVKTDAGIGLLANLEMAAGKIGAGGVKNARFVASSSAAGGLRMVVVGLTPKYSLLAGTNVALGAGARVIKSFSFLLTEADVREIEAIQPEILLLCGGVEDGNTDWLFHNAALLAGSPRLQTSVIYAGNHCVSKEVRALFLQNGKECHTVENIFPALGRLNAGPAGEAIHHIFMKRITGMKGLSKVKELVGEIVMPTPAAVLAGGRLLTEGTKQCSGLGESLIFDVGGATTDVYSYCKTLESDAKLAGAPEPDHKRTVEGDLGLCSSALSLLDAAGADKISAQCHAPQAQVQSQCRYRTEHEDYIAETEAERQLDFALARQAVFIGARRHAGHITNAYAKGARRVQEGKDLTGIKNLIGTGGPIINSVNPREVMVCALKRRDERELLLPEACQCYLDRQYLLYAVGLASSLHPEGALHIALNHITRL
ncbi:MAG: hypothetical protein H6Q60_181 [Oscillospiraceae bacterium]|nr:hypothetical protein [Oscillospiraceae bacterium]